MIEWHKVVDEDCLPSLGEWVLVYNKNCHGAEISQCQLVIVEITSHYPLTGEDKTHDELRWQSEGGGLCPVFFENNYMGIDPDHWAYFNLPDKDGD